MEKSNETITENEMLQAALAYVKRGWRVLPLNGKIAITAHGCKDATANLDIITQWWTNNPNANLGIATGAASNLFVLDIDKNLTE